jgi:hypothetical protein
MKNGLLRYVIDSHFAVTNVEDISSAEIYTTFPRLDRILQDVYKYVSPLLISYGLDNRDYGCKAVRDPPR